ncbi:MAG: CHAT domain-containing protein [Alphaproteobacteria bacterium]|nr:CHAT domain-containing protein [Alphaproteobacteria bacterium]
MPEPALTLEFTRVDDAGDAYTLRRGRQRYLLRVGEGSYKPLDLEWTDALEQELRAAAREEAAARALGLRLRALIEREDSDAYRRAPSEVVVRSAAAELYALPWELARVGPDEVPLGARAPLRYAWPDVKPAALTVRAPTHPGRVLIAWSEAGGALPHEEHVALARDAWRQAGLPDAHAPEPLPNASLDDLEGALSKRGPPVRALQLLCHGRRKDGIAELCMGSSSRPDPVNAERLRHVLSRFSDQVRLVVLTVCDSGDATAPGDTLSHARALHLSHVEAVIGARSPLRFPDAARLMTALWQSLTTMGTVEQGLAQARDALRSASSTPAWAQLQLYAAHAGLRPLQHRPYRGLLGYSRQHARLFFGRSAEIQDLQVRARAARAGEGRRWLFVTGPSGSGKSSLVRAGLMPVLLRDPDEHWAFESVRPGDALPEPPEEGALLLLVDQLEELFTRLPDAAAREAFVSAVDALLVAAEGRVVAVGTLRSDFMERCREIDLPGEAGGFDERVFDAKALLQLTPLGRAALREVVTGPAKVVGIALEPTLIDDVVSQVAGEPGALPLVAHAMDTLWLQRTSLRLDAKALEDLGGAVGALARSADAVLRRMTSAERAEARRLLISMVRVEEDTPAARQVARKGELLTGDPDRDGALDSAARALVDARLLIQGADAHGPILEIAHEALLTRWGWLREQVDEDRQLAVDVERLADWHREHLRQVELGRPTAALLKGPQLHLGQTLVEEHSDRVPRTLQGFVQQSLTAAAADLRRRRYDPLAAFVGLLLVSAFAPIGLAQVSTHLPLALAVSLLAWARWAVFSELRARYDIEGFVQAFVQATVLVSLASRGLHEELPDWDTPIFMSVGVLATLPLIRRLMQRADLPSAVTTAGIATAGGLWLLAALAWRDPRQGGELGLYLALCFAATLVEGGTWIGLVGRRLPPTSDGGQLWRILRDGQTFSALAALAYLMFIYGLNDSGTWHDLNLGLSVAVLAMMLTVNSLGSLGRERGDTPARVRAWHIGQAMVAVGIVITTLGFSRLVSFQEAHSEMGRWMTGFGLLAYTAGANLRRPALASVLPLRTPLITLMALGCVLWPWLGAARPTWQWILPIVVLAALSVLVSLIDEGVESEDSWKAPGRR